MPSAGTGLLCEHATNVSMIPRSATLCANSTDRFARQLSLPICILCIWTYLVPAHQSRIMSGPEPPYSAPSAPRAPPFLAAVTGLNGARNAVRGVDYCIGLVFVEHISPADT